MGIGDYTWTQYRYNTGYTAGSPEDQKWQTDYIKWDNSHTTNPDAWTIAVSQELIKDDIYNKQSKPKEDQPMETLFDVIVVSKDREILLDEKVVANDEGEAQLAIDLHSCLKGKGLKPRDVTILVNEIGEVKVRKEVQKVKVVDKEEE